MSSLVGLCRIYAYDTGSCKKILLIGQILGIVRRVENFRSPVANCLAQVTLVFVSRLH